MRHIFLLHILGNLLSENLPYLLILFCAALVVDYNWRRRWLYYHASKLPGPFSLPVIGNILHLVKVYFSLGESKDTYNVIYKIVQASPPIFKYWILNKLYVATTRPKDLEIILSRCLEKGPEYSYTHEFLENTLVLQGVHEWKKARKIAIKPFSTQTVNSFVEIFSEYGNELVKDLNDFPERVDIYRKLTATNFKTSCGNKIVKYLIYILPLISLPETLAGVDPHFLEGHEEYITSIKRGEELAVIRVFNPILWPNILWSYLPFRKEALKMKDKRNKFIKTIMNVRSKFGQNDENGSENFLLRHLQKSYAKENFSEQEFFDQANFLFSAAFETTATTVSCAILLLALHPDIQEKAFQEVSSIFKNSRKNITSEDLRQLEYLDRIIRETLRLFPAVPGISRSVDEDIQIDSYTIPAGATVAVLIGYLHRRKELWPDPLKFDPDRFLPEEVAKRHKCSYMPFSYGPRNCLGYRYGMVSMKVILSILLNNFKVKSTNYSKIDDIDFVFHITARPKNDIFVQLEKRQ